MFQLPNTYICLVINYNWQFDIITKLAFWHVNLVYDSAGAASHSLHCFSNRISKAFECASWILIHLMCPLGIINCSNWIFECIYASSITSSDGSVAYAFVSIFVKACSKLVNYLMPLLWKKENKFRKAELKV